MGFSHGGVDFEIAFVLNFYVVFGFSLLFFHGGFYLKVWILKLVLCVFDVFVWFFMGSGFAGCSCNL